jgi:hypothetical protein
MQTPDCAKDLSSLEKRIRDTRDWLKQEAPECFVEQKHTDEGTQERVYWHYGYLVGLRDAIRFLTENQTTPSTRSENKSPASFSV